MDFLNENADIKHKSRVHTSSCIYDSINNSILKYNPSHYSYDKGIEVDLKEKKILTEPAVILSQVYSNVELCKILAYKQYELGITPPFYNEVAKINKFLKDKKTITVVLKDNREVKTKANITDIIDFYNGVFILERDLFDLQFYEDDLELRNINNLKALKYGKTDFSIETANLKPLSQQLDEIIKNENQGIICNIPKQELEKEE